MLEPLPHQQWPHKQWQRVSPAAIVYFIMKFLGQFLRQGIQGFLPLAAIVFTAGENRWFIISLVLGAAVILLILGAFVSYLKFRFRITDDTILIQSGVFTRKRLTLNFARIQNVALIEPLYFRPFGLVVLDIESAGSSSDEVKIGGVARPLAAAIRATVLSHRQSTNDIGEELPTEPKKEDSAAAKNEVLVKHPLSELARYGLSNNNVWVMASLGAALISQIKWSRYAFFNDFKDAAGSAIKTNIFTAISYGLLSLVVIVSILLLVSVIGAIIINYKYQLDYDGKRFHRSKGLFERSETSLLINKVQLLTLRQPWPARLLQRWHLYLSQVSFTKAHDVKPETGNQSFIIPSVTAAFSHYFSSILFPDFDWKSLNLKPIHFKYVKKILLYIFVPISIPPTISITLGSGSALGLLPLLLPLLAAPFVLLRWKRYGYARDGHHGIIRSGFLGQKLTIFSFYKVQTVSVVRSPGQRRAGLATLHIKLAGASLTLPYIPLGDAMKWHDMILFRIENSQREWM